MSAIKRKTARGLCYLDIKDLLKFDPTLHYFSVCPACKELVSEHNDEDFQRDQLEKITAERDDDEVVRAAERNVSGGEHVDITEEDSPRPRKKAKPTPSAIEAAILVQQGKLCCKIGCLRRPTYNQRGLRARFCRLHKEDDMVKSKQKNCQQEGCVNPAVYFHKGVKGGLKVCEEHREDGMTIITACGLLCCAEGCVKSASFNFEGEKARFCMTHKEKDMINVYRQKKLCIHEGCTLSASFNLPGKKIARYCSSHKLKDMINLKSTVCAKEGCTVQPYYNFRGEKRGKYCTRHQEEGMVNLLIIRANRVCDRSGCEKCGCFAFSKADKVRYCASHKERDMVDVQNASCDNEGCDKRPNFNFSGLRKGRFCATHKEEGMVNVVNERRKEREGLIAPSGNYEY